MAASLIKISLQCTRNAVDMARLMVTFGCVALWEIVNHVMMSNFMATIFMLQVYLRDGVYKLNLGY